jgi:hypothetical protein
MGAAAIPAAEALLSLKHAAALVCDSAAIAAKKLGRCRALENEIVLPIRIRIALIGLDL